MRKFLSIGSCVCLSAMFLVGCGSVATEDSGNTPASDAPQYTTYKFNETLKDGTKVTCIYLEGYKQGGLWCRELNSNPNSETK